MRIPRAVVGVVLVVLIGLMVSLAAVTKEAAGAKTGIEIAPDEEIRTQLVGSWRIVSASFGGVPSELHRTSITIKHITPVHLIWIGYQPDDRKIFRSAGGTWKVVDGKYIETMRYGLDPQFKQNVFGKDFAFDCRFEGDLWIQSATLPDGSEMIETWQRIQPEEDVALKPADRKAES
jgi:hypothetical protein